MTDHPLSSTTLYARKEGLRRYPEYWGRFLEWFRAKDDRRVGNVFRYGAHVTRWREANKELAGTEDNCMRESISDVGELLSRKNDIVVGTATVLLLCKERP